MVEQLTEITSFVGEYFSTDPLYGKIENKIVVVKHINNPQGHYALFNEYIGYALASKLGIPTPEYGFAIFKENKTKNYLEPDYSIKNNDIFTYTKLENAVIQIDSPLYTATIDIEEIIKLIIFDIFIANYDRNKGNLLLKMPKKGKKASLFPIDYTHIFPGQCIWVDVLRQPLPSIKEIVGEIFSYGGHQSLIENRIIDEKTIDEVARDFKKNLECIDISDTIEEIPSVLLNMYDNEDINNLKGYLFRNIHEFDYIIKEIKRYLVR
ncbi:phosphatidylinositol kinase [Staphylococcus rostri]|uniref:Phosphatidylinositol kinase n=1 Tax=Staphylococcus rostri TaxID=522262 RepID=A0A2K3YPE7_9STAP|nr:phosphatidylinositol kinase [Staphylococcus rostri]